MMVEGLTPLPYPLLATHLLKFTCSCNVCVLTTDDVFWHCLTLAVCYQLVQAVLKIGCVLAIKVR